jgi:hypothetical protein
MDDMVISLIVIVSTGIVVGLIFYLVYVKKKKTEKALSELAIQNGWMCESFKEPLSWGYRIQGPEWTIESITETSGNSVEMAQNNTSQFTRLRSTMMSLPGQLLVNPHKAGSTSLNQIHPAMLRKLSGLFGGDAFSGLEELAVGSPQLREYYAIYGKAGEDYSKVISHQVESILLNWRGERPWIKIGNGGLEIEIRNRNIQKPEEIQNLVDLAGSLAVSSRQ